MAAFGRNRHYRWNEVTPQHWLETAKRCGLVGMSEIMARVADEAPKIIETVERWLPKDFPEFVAHPIFEGLRSQAPKLAVSGSE